MEAKFLKIFTNVNLNLNIVETRIFISDLRTAMQTYQDNNRDRLTSPDILLLSALNGDMNSQTEFMNLLVLGTGSMPYYNFYKNWLDNNWTNYGV